MAAYANLVRSLHKLLPRGRALPVIDLVLAVWLAGWLVLGLAVEHQVRESGESATANAGTFLPAVAGVWPGS